MKKKLEAKVEANVKVYLVPVLNDRFLVYEGGQHDSKTRA